MEAKCIHRHRKNGGSLVKTMNSISPILNLLMQYQIWCTLNLKSYFEMTSVSQCAVTIQPKRVIIF